MHTGHHQTEQIYQAQESGYPMLFAIDMLILPPSNLCKIRGVNDRSTSKRI